jgi:hypothetical protein
MKRMASKLVRVVSRGYHEVGTGNIIPASDLIPFGLLEEFNTIKFMENHPYIVMHDEEGILLPVLKYAENYASVMNADYHLISGFMPGVECKWEDDLKLQLYVKNPAVRVSS